MIKKLLSTSIVLLILMALSSCASNAYNQGSGSQSNPQNEGGIVGTGNSINCNHPENKHNPECFDDQY